MKEYASQNKDITDIAIVGDLNQDADSNQIQQFFKDSEVIDMCQYFNKIKANQLDSINFNGSKRINTLL